MEATKDLEIIEHDTLQTALETLLQQYEASVGSEVGGVPSEILQGRRKFQETEPLWYCKNQPIAPMRP